MPAEDVNAAALGPELDIQKLQSLPSEQQDLYLLTFTSDLARHVAALDGDGASAQQLYIKKEVFKVINLSSPASTRVVRNNLGYCLGGVFGKGDRKLLFETINELLAIVNNTGKSDIKAANAAVHCLGAVFESSGDSVISIASGTCQSILRLLKGAQNHVGYRTALFKALGRIVKGVGKSVDEVMARDIWKQVRPAIPGDKSLLCQANACWCLEQLVYWTPYFSNSSDFDKLQSVIWKALDSASPIVRRAAASCLSTILIKNYSPTPIVERLDSIRRKSRKPKITNTDEAEQVGRTSSPAPPVTRLSFDLNGMLSQLSSHYCRLSTGNKARAGLSLCYIQICKGLQDGIVANYYGDIAQHLFENLLCNTNILNNRYRLLISRRFVQIILGDIIGRKLLSETCQLDAIRFLVNSILKDYPQSDVKERVEPKKEVLVGALDALTVLIELLGSAVSGLAEFCRGSLIQVLEHPSYTVQVHASKCLQALVLACPQQLLLVVTLCINSLNREVGLLTGSRRSPHRCLGFALGLAATVSTSSSQPLYGSVDVYSRVLSQATSLLKSSSSSDLRVSSIQIQVAWILIGGLMSLGPNFVKIHLPQLLLLWKNALPKPLSKDNIGQRGILELSFLAHVRECALGSVRAFLSFNSRLLTIDVSKRLATMLQNTTMFLTSLPAKKVTDDVEKLLSPALQLQDYDLLVRRRVFDCYTQLVKLSPHSSHEALLQSNLLTMAASSFANPQAASTTSLSASIATASGNSQSIWDVGDNSGFGLTGLLSGLDFTFIPHREHTVQPSALPQHGIDATLDRIIRSPICGALEHESNQLYAISGKRTANPLGTGVVDSAIQLFAVSLPAQSPKIQEGVIEQLSTLLASSGRQQNPAREAAVILNVATALLLALEAAKDTPLASSNLKSAEVEKALQEILHTFVIHSDLTIRHLAAETLGRLCKSSGHEFISHEINHLIGLIVSERDPNVRSGCAMALGYIHAELGGMAASLHMRPILGVLTSLASDPHPTVHYWALDGLSKIADSAGLAFSGYVSSTLGTLAQLYFMDSHNDETGLLASSNLEVDFPALGAIARCVNSMINVLGPDLQDATKTRNMILTLTYQFQSESLPAATIESLKCLENLSMYAPGHVSFKPYVQQLRTKIGSDTPDIQNTALTGLVTAMRRGAEEVLAVEPGLEDQLWSITNDMYGEGMMRNIIQDWVEQSGLQQIDLWVHRVQRILTKAVKSDAQTPTQEFAKGPAELELQDDEVAGFNVASKDDKSHAGLSSSPTQELLRWQVRCAALDCLKEILSSVARDVGTYGHSSAIAALQHRIADIVRISFSASTSSIVDLRIRGIQIIGRLLQIFGRVPDPDFPEVTLLEQYQAQIGSALTPAFAVDSSPVLAAEAVSVCAVFISTGIVTDAERMGRILNLLLSSLEEFTRDSESAALGDLKGLSSNAQVMLKLAVFSAWADLQIASHEQKYLENVVRPHLTKLTPLWLASLREYARLKFEPEISTSGSPGSLTGGLDTIYAALNRETLLGFYQACWLKFVDAITSLIDEDSDFVFDALEGKTEHAERNGASNEGHDISYRDEPVAFFFVLFGISFEALVVTSGSESTVTQDRTLQILSAMQKILRPTVAGLAIYQHAIFSETMDLLDRLVLTEGLEVQTITVEIARNLCTGHPFARKFQITSQDEESLSDDIDQLFELTRIIVLVISKHVYDLSRTNTTSSAPLSEDTVSLVILALTALVDSAEVFPAVIKGDLHACVLHVISTILSTGACQDAVVPQTLPIFKRFVTSLAKNPQHETVTQLRNALSRFLVILQNAQRRETETALSCEKNTLLACTILLTSVAKILPASDPLLTRFVDALNDCLGNRMTTKVAARLCHSLLLLPTLSSEGLAGPTEFALSALLLPRLITFLAKTSDVGTTEEVRPLVAQALASFALGLPEKQRPAAFEIIIPTLLRRASEEGKGVWKETATRLVEMAGRESVIFRSIMGKMSTEQRDFVEGIIRAGGVGAAMAGEENAGPGNMQTGLKEPSIALRMDFS